MTLTPEQRTALIAALENGGRVPEATTVLERVAEVNSHVRLRFVEVVREDEVDPRKKTDDVFLRLTRAGHIVAQQCKRIDDLERENEREIAKAVEFAAPEECPVTGLPFFCLMSAEEGGGWVPTYGGPYDSYTIPTRYSDGLWVRERFDHDRGTCGDWECCSGLDNERIGELERENRLLTSPCGFCDEYWDCKKRQCGCVETHD